MSRLLFLVLCFGLGIPSFSNTDTDSLLFLLKTARDSSLEYQIDLEWNLMSAYYRLNQPDSQLYYADQILEKAQLIDDQHHIAKVLQAKGIIYSTQRQYEVALNYFDSAIVISEQILDTPIIVKSTFDIGFIYYRKAEYAKALEYFQKIANHHEEFLARNNPTRLFYTYNAIGVNYKSLSEFDTAIVYYNKALDYAKPGSNDEGVIYSNIKNIYLVKGDQYAAIDYAQKSLNVFQNLKDSLGIALSYNGLAYLYEEIQNYDLMYNNIQKSIKIQLQLKAPDEELLEGSYMQLVQFYLLKHQLDSASIMLEKAELINSKTGNQENLYRIHTRSGELAKKQNKLELAEEHFRDALHLAYEIQSPWSQANSLYCLGEIYEKKHQSPKAITFLKQSIEKSEAINSIRLARDGHRLLAHIYEKLNILDSAYYYLISSHQLSDSLINLDKVHKIASLQRQFQSEEQKRKISEQQLQLLQKGQQLKRSYLTGGSAFLIALCVLTIFLYFSFRNQQKLNQNLNKSLTYLESVNQKIVSHFVYPSNRGNEKNTHHLSLGQKVFQKIEQLSKSIEPIIQINPEGHLSEELIKMEEKFTSVIEELKSFNYTVAHDLRIPLAHIQHLTEQLKRQAGSLRKNDSIDMVRKAEEVNAASKKLEQMFQKLLLYSKIDNQALDYSYFDLEMLVGDIINEFDHKLKDS